MPKIDIIPHNVSVNMFKLLIQTCI